MSGRSLAVDPGLWQKRKKGITTTIRPRDDTKEVLLLPALIKMISLQ
ncbi:MAG TPA: hypothetical protein VKA34_03065 [Balneolales bacterium]|nr:hypothetical protein [Balneolales bacterium]